MNEIDLPRIRIEVGENQFDSRVYINGLDISNIVTRVAFVLDVNDPTVPHVELTIVSIPELPDEIKALVTAKIIETA